ncbi:hypothetical protein, partial [Nocardia cyriacigeorgica]|uniref:hypothetical protein n=1 Tax=Nocardia cyriacigeorgica TaxID=135487 RepID=UPI002456521B
PGRTTRMRQIVGRDTAGIGALATRGRARATFTFFLTAPRRRRQVWRECVARRMVLQCGVGLDVAVISTVSAIISDRVTCP